MTIYRGEIKGEKLSLAIVISRFNESIGKALLKSALATFEEHGVKKSAIDIFYVPGAFEIPLVAEKLAKSGAYDAILTLGAVIRGETKHFDIISEAVTSGIRVASQNTGVPILFSVLTCDNEKQARERSSGKLNVGRQNALATLEMANLMKKISCV